MSCGCGCNGMGAACAYWTPAKRIGAACQPWTPVRRVGELGPSRMRRRGRTMGDAADSGGELDWSAQLQSYVQDGLDDYQTAREAFNAAQQALDVLNAKTQAQWKAVQAGMETFVQILTTAVGAPWIGALFNSWFSQQPGAAAGPGECVQDPPSSPDWPTLRTWKYYRPWGDPFGSDYATPKPGTFEAFAQPQLEYNKVLYNNCFDDKATDRADLLAHLVAVWNANHDGPTRTIARKVNPSGWNEIPVWDPIADALWWGIIKKYPCDGAFCTNPNRPTDVTLTFDINDGPLKAPKVVTLRLPPGHPLASSSTAASAPAPASSSSSSASTTAAVVAGAGLVAAGGLYVYLRGLPPALARLIR